MTTYATFGGGPADVVTDDSGNAVGNYELRVYLSGVQVTDVLDKASAPLAGGVVRTEAATNSTAHTVKGRYIFKAPDTSAYYRLRDNAGNEWTVVSQEALQRVGPAIDAAYAAQAAAADAVEHSQDALTAVNGLFASPEAFGAVGDGTTNDTPAWQAALDFLASRGGGHFIASGRYRLATTARVSRDTWVHCHGAYITPSSTGMPLLYNYRDGDNPSGYNGNGNILVEGGVWDMRGHANTSADPHNAMTFTHARNIVVRNLIVRNVRGYHAVEPHAVFNFVADNVRAEGYVDPGGLTTPREAIQLDMVGQPWDDGTPCRWVTLRNIYAGPSPVTGEGGTWKRVIGSHTVGATQHDQITIEGVSGDGVQDVVRPYSWTNTSLRNVRGRNITGTAILADCADGLSGRGLAVDGVQVDGCASVISVQPSPAGTGTWSFVSIDNVQARSGTSSSLAMIDVAGVNHVLVGAVRMDTSVSHGIRISGNDPVVAGPVALTSMGGIGILVLGYLASQVGGIISGYAIQSCGSYAIQVGGGTTAAPLGLADVTIGPGYIKTPTNGAGAIRLSVGARNGKVQGITLRGGNAVSGASGSQTGGAVNVHPDATGNRIVGCDFGGTAAYTRATWYAINGSGSWPGAAVAYGGAIVAPGTGSGQLGDATTSTQPRFDNWVLAA